jgi:uncharacterized membrane protein
MTTDPFVKVLLAIVGTFLLFLVVYPMRKERGKRDRWWW